MIIGKVSFSASKRSSGAGIYKKPSWEPQGPGRCIGENIGSLTEDWARAECQGIFC